MRCYRLGRDVSCFWVSYPELPSRQIDKRLPPGPPTQGFGLLICRSDLHAGSTISLSIRIDSQRPGMVNAAVTVRNAEIASVIDEIPYGIQ